MSRRKQTPSKLQPLLLSSVGEYRPVHKKVFRKPRSPNLTYNVLIPNKEETKQYYIGELCLGHTNNIIPNKYMTCKVSFPKNEENNMLIITMDEVTAVITLALETDFVKSIFGSKIFATHFKTVTSSDNEISVVCEIYFEQLPLRKFSERIGNTIQELFNNFFNISVNTSNILNTQVQTNSDIVKLYQQLYNLRKNNSESINATNSINVNHSKLKPRLRKYQEEAVRWMISREKELLNHNKDTLHPLYNKITLKSGLDVYYDRFSGFVEIERPTIPESAIGGILADEMGLGKTVEVLACILLNNKGGNNNEDSEEKPVIEKQCKKRKLIIDNSNSEHTPPKRALQVEKTMSFKNKSTNYIALQKLYNTALKEYCTSNYNDKSHDIKTKEAIECICGNTCVENTVKCVKCNKIQHKSCLGYEEEFGDYLCPQCWTFEPLLDSTATLIVTPHSLRAQWCNEILKHITGPFKVLVYYGGNLASPIYPTQLQNTYDIVITTYAVLQNELKLTGTGVAEHKLRNVRKYGHIGSVLTRIRWWRLCLDEAQTVDAPTRMVSEMAQKITAQYRWAVTGTPISKSLCDLQGLIDYLHITPYNDLNSWNNILYHPYINGDTTPMLEFLSKVLWRTSKANVIEQLGLPEQTFVKHVLEFSAVEKYFYKREHEQSSNEFLTKLDTKSRLFDDDWLIEKIDKSTLKSQLSPLGILRQACSYPNTVRGKYLATKKQVKSMKDLLEALILKNSTESEECLRFIISALNGLAGIYLLLQSPQVAIDKYREVLQLSARFSKDITVDKLQQIHAMHNLADVIKCYPPQAPTLRDDTLKEDCLKIEQQYIKKFMKDSFEMYEATLASIQHIENLTKRYILKDGQWYALGLEWIFVNDYEADLFQKLQTAIDTVSVKSNFSMHNLNEKYLLRLIYQWNHELFEARDDLLNSIDSIYSITDSTDGQIVIDDKIVSEAVDCHLRPERKQKTKPRKCIICETNESLRNYESKLFSMVKRKTVYEAMSLSGTWKPTVEELIFRSIHLCLKSKDAEQDLIQDGETYLNIVDSLKKEFKEVRKFWTYLDQQVCGQDEVIICKSRLQLKDPTTQDKEETKQQNRTLKNLSYTSENKLETINLLTEHELELQRISLNSDYIANTNKLETLLGTQGYLETLRKQQYEGQSPDPCPICKNSLEQHWSILNCGHSYCLECVQLILEKIVGDTIQCSVCRKREKVQDISYIKGGGTNSAPEDGSIEVKGSHSTKIEAVIRLVLQLVQADKSVKVLIFSSWENVLKGIRYALEDNYIRVESILLPSNSEKHIANFKDPSANVTVLLLPIHLGAKGLNLIEATHVVLVEPLLNPADELQAIGRVHRIGQTKPTVVHKFLIKNTIEENIDQATSSNPDDWDKSKLTLGQLKQLFLSNGTSEVDKAEEINDGVQTDG